MKKYLSLFLLSILLMSCGTRVDDTEINTNNGETPIIEENVNEIGINEMDVEDVEENINEEEVVEDTNEMTQTGTSEEESSSDEIIPEDEIDDIINDIEAEIAPLVEEVSTASGELK